MKFRKMIVHFPAWNYDVVVVVAKDINAAAKSLHLLSVDEPPPADKATGGLTRHEKGEGRSYLFLKTLSVSNIAHESWHCIRRMLWYAGADLDSETVAYHLGYLTQRVYDFVHKKKQ